MKTKYLASYPGKKSKLIEAFDAHSARKQSAYWFGCAVESDRLTVTESEPAPCPYLSGGTISDSRYHSANE